MKNNTQIFDANNFELLSNAQMGSVLGGDGPYTTSTDGTTCPNPIILIKK